MKVIIKNVGAAVLLFAALFAADSAAAREPDFVRVPLKQPFVPQHELRLTGAAWPLISTNMRYTHYDYYYHGDYYSTPRHGDTYTAGAWTLSYGYRFKKWVDLTAAVTYYGEYSTLYDRLDNSKIATDNRTCIAVMPIVRFTWLNRTWVRLYSHVGIGLLFDTHRPDRGFSLTTVSGQFVPIGIAVGKSFFGFAEVGVGTQGCLLAGIGYRFNAKKESK